MIRPDMAINQVESPTTLWCKSGHVAPKDVRFFSISGDTLARDRWGVYCEDCLKKANERLREMKANGSWEIYKDQPYR